MFDLWEQGKGPRQNLSGPMVKGPRRTSCQFLGQELRTQECSSCAGKVRLKVFACQLHKECTMGKWLDGVATCATCLDYETSANHT